MVMSVKARKARSGTDERKKGGSVKTANAPPRTSIASASQRFDVVIVGAGFAGIAAADMIERWNTSNPGAALTYVVLDASSREGGRTATTSPKYGYLDLGGQYLSDPATGQQPYIHALIRRFGIQLVNVDVDDKRERVYEWDGGRIEFSGPSGPSPIPPVPNLDGYVAKIEALVDTLKPFLGRSWDAPNAVTLDQQSVQSWNRGEAPNDRAADLLTIGVRAAYSVEPRDISLLHFLHYGATCGAFTNYEINGESKRMKYGTIDLYRNIVASLATGAVQRPQQVATVDQDLKNSRVTVITTQGDSFVARRVIVAMSPAASAKITYTPTQSAARDAVCAGAPTARTIKGFAIFNRPFWAPKYAGYAISSVGPVVWIKETTSTLDDGTVIPTLMTFIVADEAEPWSKLTKAQKRAALITQLARVFATTEAVVDGCLVDYLEKDWGNDPFAAGCPAGCFAPNVLTRIVDRAPAGVALATPFHMIHYAGSETGTDWQGGYMNGAIQSGQRAASEVISALNQAIGPPFLPPTTVVPATSCAVAASTASKPSPMAAKSPATKPLGTSPVIPARALQTRPMASLAHTASAKKSAATSVAGRPIARRAALKRKPRKR